jgi:S1-C subfamily serine protease/curli biogenesis system outer membrane secretion channel CsgG
MRRLSRKIIGVGLPLAATLLFLSWCTAWAAAWGIVCGDSANPPGAVVRSVKAAGPAARAGIAPGDVVVAVNGIPVTKAKEFRRSLEKYGHASKLKLTISRQGWQKDIVLTGSQPAAAKPRNWFGMKVGPAPNGKPGAAITFVTPGGPAAQAGLKAGDIITICQGRKVFKPEELAAEVRQNPPGKELALVVVRGGWEKDLALKPAARPGPSPSSGRSPGQALSANGNPSGLCSGGWLGVAIRNQPNAGGGAEVVSVEAAGTASAMGLKAADLVLAVNNTPVSSAAELVSAVRRIPPKSKFSLTVRRAGKDLVLYGTMGGLPAEQCLNRRIAAAFAARDKAQAVALAKEYLQQNPQDPDRHDRMARVYLAAGDTTSALTSALKALELSPGKTKALMRVADVYYWRGEYERSEEYARKVLEKEEANAAAWRLLSDIFTKQKRYDEAVDAINEAVRLAPPASYAQQYNLGWNLMRLKRYDEAEQSLRKALNLRPGYPNALLTLGTCLASQGKNAEAITYWRKASQLDPQGNVGKVARQNLARMQVNAALNEGSQMPAGKPSGRKATITVGDFQVKAAGAGQFIGDGLREMFLTALFNSNYFIVVERMDLKGLAAEQALSRSGMARRDQAIPQGAMDVAELYVYGSVTEFDPQAKGAAFGTAMPNMPMTLNQSYKEAHMAVDFRVVDVKTGRILGTKRIPGLAISTKTGMGFGIKLGKITMPTSFSMFRNTPMELAIRNCIQKGAMFVINTTPESYFRHK